MAQALPILKTYLKDWEGKKLQDLGLQAQKVKLLIE